MREMRSRELLLLLGTLCLVAAGCSRLTFVKPKLERGDYTRVAPEYTVREDPQARKRLAALDRVALAEDRLRAGDLDAAEAQARAAIQADATVAGAHTVLALVADRRGDTAGAGREYARAAELAPRRGSTLNNYAVWLCSNGRQAESLPLFAQALRDPGYDTPAVALANAGACALEAGRPVEAERDLRRALELDPENPVALATMARLSFRQGDYLQARAFSQRRLAAAPASAQVLQLASQIEQKLGDSAAMAGYVQRLRAEFPDTQTPRGDESQQ
nr:type IV pilus biogenesis/stability protein PilW [Luteimonas lumbrici]